MDYAIKFETVSHFYSIENNQKLAALKGVNLSIRPGSFNTIIGRTGSGKSTLVKHINGLLKPTTGRVLIGKQVIDNSVKDKDLVSIRQQVGMVFQFPEKQLFGESVKKDIEFGPRNFFNDENKIESLTMNAFHAVGLSDSVLNVSPFELSGGQQRRVAIAGVIACQPDILVLDEPTVGLDEAGKNSLMKLINQLHHDLKMTIVMVTHQMELVAQYADNVIIMQDGKIIQTATPQRFFNDNQLVQESGVDLPATVYFARQLQQRGMLFDQLPITDDELIEFLKQRSDKNG